MSNLSEIGAIVKGILTLINGNPESKAFRLSKRQKRYEKRQLKYAEKELKSLKKDLSKDEDGFTEADKKLVAELETAITNKRIELIKN